VIARYKNSETGEIVSAKEYERRVQMQQGQYIVTPSYPQMTAAPQGTVSGIANPNSGTDGGGAAIAGKARISDTGVYLAPGQMAPAQQQSAQPMIAGQPLVQGGDSQGQAGAPVGQPGVETVTQAGIPTSTLPTAPQEQSGGNPLIMPGAKMLTQGQTAPAQATPAQAKSMRFYAANSTPESGGMRTKSHAFLDSTSVAILLPSLVLLAIIIAAAHKKRLFPWQTIKTFNPPSGLMSPNEYQKSFLCPPNLRRHGRWGKVNPSATWTEQDGIVLPFGFMARTQLPVTIPLGRLPNKNMFLVAPSGSGKTTLMRAVIKAMLAKPCVIIALEAKANDPNLDQKKEGFKYTVLPEAKQAGFETLYFNPLDEEASIHWNPLEADPTQFASSIVQDVNSLEAEQQHWAERDFGYIEAMARLLKWGAVEVINRDEAGAACEFNELPCNPRGLMELVYSRDNIVESLRRAKTNPEVEPKEFSKVNGTLSQLIQSNSDFNNNIQGVRGRLRMFKNKFILKVTEESNVNLKISMHKPTVLIFGAPASLGPDAESLAACFVYQMEQALHTRYGTASVLPLFAFFDEYQTLNIDMAGRLSAIVRGANGGLAIILQNISQIAGKVGADPTSGGAAELKTIFSNSAIRICLHNADESTSKFFSDEIGKHAVIVPGIADQFDGSNIFPIAWRRIHSQQVVPRIDQDSIKRMEKHHALVFLAPAGDSEHGEIKPLMVDLRGIEEIARMHLMHNMSSRAEANAHAQAQAAQGDSSQQQAPAFAQAQQMLVPPSRNGMTQEVGTAAQVNPNALAQDTAVQANTQTTTYDPQVHEPPVSNVRSEVQAPAQAANLRTCPHCWQAAGKGRFCIECGKEIGAATSDAAPAATPVAEVAQASHAGVSASDAQSLLAARVQSTNNQIGQTMASGQTLSDVIQSQAGVPPQRPPVTSLNLDHNRFRHPDDNFAQQIGANKKIEL
jgi:type IV secretory pathway TraG/TraD family ATPase VirD4